MTEGAEICPPGIGTSSPATLAAGMLRLRELDRALGRLVAGREDELLNGTVLHPWSGLEVLSIGVAAARRAGDVVYGTHRGLGHCLAWGIDIDQAIAETLGRERGMGKGRGGHMHILDAAAGIGGTNGIVAGGLPQAVGAAMAQQVRGTGNVVVAFTGDGSTNTGSFHESLNLAVVWRLPLVVIVEDNGITEAMRSADLLAAESVTARGAAYGVPAAEVAGDDIEAIVAAAQEALARARAGDGPSFITCNVTRSAGHYAGDRQHYRERAEAEQAAANDPVARALCRLPIDDDEIARLTAEATAEAERVLARGLQGGAASAATLLEDGDVLGARDRRTAA